VTLPRKDVRFYLDAHQHAALVAVCDALGVDINEQIESVVTGWIGRRVSEAIVIARATERLGIVRIDPETSGQPRRSTE
jgi:hypothetical protein